MKKRPVLHQFASVCIAASVFLCSAASTHANTFTFPQQFHYPGLVFSTPLAFSHPTLLSQPAATINFTSQNTLRLNKDTKTQPLEAIVLTPIVSTTTDEQNQPTLPQPTPTIYIPTTPAKVAMQENTPTPTPTTLPTTAPTYSPAPQANPGGLDAADLFGMVNAYRASHGLPAFQQDAKTCSLAQERAPEVAGEVASGNMHAGLKAMNLDYWNTENIISMNSDQAAFTWWINDPIHHDAIVSNNTYSCVACSGNSCAEEFTSYQQK